MSASKDQKARFEEQRQDSRKEKATLDLKVRDLQDNDKSSKTEHETLRRQLDTLEKELEQKRRQLADLLPEYEAKKLQETQVRAALDIASGKRDTLFAKQGLNTRFKTSAERDKHLQGEMTSMKKTTEDYGNQIKELKTSIQQTTAKVANLTKDIEQSKKESEARSKTLESMKVDVAKQSSKRDSITNEKKSALLIISLGRKEPSITSLSGFLLLLLLKKTLGTRERAGTEHQEPTRDAAPQGERALQHSVQGY